MIKKPVNLFDVCRLCLQSGQELTSIFDDQVPQQPETVGLSHKILACVSIQVSSSDQGPRKICAKCMNNINSWQQFKDNCKAVDAYLQKYLNQVIEQNVPLPKANEITNNASENSLLGELSLSSFDSVFEKNVNLKSNLSSILDVYLNGETSPLLNEPDKIVDGSNSTATDEVKDTSPKSVIPDPAESCPDVNNSPKKIRKGYECELCNNTFAKFTNLLHHDDTVHQNIFRKYSCLTCCRLFISSSRMKQHELSHREKLHKCTVCDKLFSSAKSLQVHSRLHSGKYKCSSCGYVSTSKLYLDEHLLKHVGNETMYVCKVCTMSFKYRSSLLRHENIHLKHGGKLYKCSICNVATRRRCELQDHMVVHNNSESSANEHKCHICPKSCKTKKSLRAHVVRHNGGTFECEVCKKKVHSKFELREHLETHSHVKQFTCFHCDKKFCFRSTLLKHLRSKFPRVRSDIAVI